MNLRDRIMNIKCDPSFVFQQRLIGLGDTPLYAAGHRDARHAAAELATQADAINAQLLEALQRAADTLRDTKMYFHALCKAEGAEAYALAEQDARAAIRAATEGA